MLLSRKFAKKVDNLNMSIIGGPVSASAAGAPESKRHINKAKEKRRNDEALERRRFEDSLELHISQVESSAAVEPLKEHASDDAESEGHANSQIPFQYPFATNLTPYGPYPAAARPNPPQSETLEAQTSDHTTNETASADTCKEDANTTDDDSPEANRSIDITG